MRIAHHPEPLVRRRLGVAVQDLADAIDEHFGAAAGNAVQARRDEPVDDRGHRQLRKPRDVQDFRWRERVQLEAGIAALHRAEQILVPADRDVGIVSALQQELHAAEPDRLVDLREDLVEAERVAFARSHRPVERAELAAGDADVRVVDVAVDDVGDDAVRVPAAADVVGEAAQQWRGRVAIERQRVVRRQTLAACDALGNPGDRHNHHSTAGANGVRTGRCSPTRSRPNARRRRRPARPGSG